MTREEKIRLLTMRADGMTYEAIAKEFGVTKQHVQHTAVECVCVRKREVEAMRIIYPALRQYIFENCGNSVARFSKRCDMTSLKPFLTGERGANSRTIDAILKTTGLSFEKAFQTEERT